MLSRRTANRKRPFVLLIFRDLLAHIFLNWAFPTPSTSLLLVFRPSCNYLVLITSKRLLPEMKGWQDSNLCIEQQPDARIKVCLGLFDLHHMRDNSVIRYVLLKIIPYYFKCNFYDGLLHISLHERWLLYDL